MDYPEPKLIVGGSHDGERIKGSHGRVLRLPMKGQRLPGSFLDSDLGPIFVEEYREFRHGLGRKAFSVWVPKDWTDEDAAIEVFGRIAILWQKVIDGEVDEDRR